ncbi:uncharacterized protein Z518_02281 [Rhinocladiella mackenziei CBS 650.93]|uniref:HRDC domain-containing protein n=1 Tax=Rhinocladiella mackenziei CBS 650.93 TaxID=1442369 RepID=A0A0D2HB11_9EURO|nr:uncharacterized protein Z518_02281 [Rhinocladiella mackenziei CBS 650.93]KIX07628.1 hypothetical protein Z518_02281 [Rhinocladiella mackenziei CBS 650.93]
MDLTADFKSFQELVQSSLINVTRTANQISNQDLSFHRSSSEKLSRALDRQNAHLLRLTNKLLKAATKDTNIKAPSLQSQDDIEDRWPRIVDVIDNLLEKTDSKLDEVSGAFQRQSLNDRGVVPTPKPGTPVSDFPQSSPKVIKKPQQLFERKVNNFETSHFKPLLRTKPHAVVPLEESIGDEDTGYKHPYQREIEEYAYPASVYQTRPPIPFNPADGSEATFVDTEEGVKEMLEELKGATEIAVDLEHNDQRSYIGMVCLMQISTREKDWIVDTLKPWRENLQILNEVFADPKILKVLHGSNMDIIWLQRDLGLYVVGLFDTFHASCALQIQGKGLKHLLHRFANFEAQKQYQTADWRVRPLPPELVDYARSDTHYLLHIYDHVRNMLIESSTPTENLTDHVLTQSKKEALQVYDHPFYDSEFGRGSYGWLGLLMQRTVTFNKEQFGVFRAVHAWRDRKAREMDEGIQYILPNRLLFLIATNMPTSVFNFHVSIRGVPKTLLDNLKNLPELIEVIKKGKHEGRDGKSFQEVMRHYEEVHGAYPYRSRRERKEQPSTTYSGLGATLQQLTANGDIGIASPSLNYDGYVENDTPIAARCSTSLFWGEVAPQYRQSPPEATTAVHALISILPLPVLATGSEVDEVTTPAKMQPAAVVMTAQEQLRSKVSEIFTLKNVSPPKKRKAEDVDDSIVVPSTAPKLTPVNGSPPTFKEATILSAEASDPEDVPKSHAQEKHKSDKKAKREARREAKRLTAEAATKTTQPFDYASAESLLNQPSPAVQGNANGQATKRMNPFAKALDTSTGAKRAKMGKELAGKSVTFTS